MAKITCIFRRGTCSTIFKKNYKEMKEWWDNWGNFFWLQLEKYGELGRDKHCSRYNAPSLFQNLQKRSLTSCSEHGTLQTFDHYGSQAGFPYFKWQVLYIERGPLSPPCDVMGSSVGHQCLVWFFFVIVR